MRRFSSVWVLGLFVAVCFGLFGLLGPTPTHVHAQDAEDKPAAKQAASLGVLAPHLLYGEAADGLWIGKTDGNGYRLINPKDPNAITYFFGGAVPDDHGKRTIEVKTVMLQGDGQAGLLYGLVDDPKEYFLFVINRAGRVQVLHRTPNDGIVTAMGTNLQRKDGEANGPVVVTLRIVESGDTAEVFINDAKLGQLQGPTVGKGRVGIAAAGRVDALFLDFKLEADDK